MPPVARRKNAVRRRRVVRKQGGGLLDFLRNAHNFIKSNKIISTVGNALAPVLPVAGTIGKVAAAAGYGRRRRPGRPRRVGRPVGSGLRTHMRKRRVRRQGGSLKSILSKVHGFVRANQLVSKGLTHFGHPKLASIASAAGYGRRRTVRRRYCGGANFSTNQISAPRFS